MRQFSRTESPFSLNLLFFKGEHFSCAQLSQFSRTDTFRLQPHPTSKAGEKRPGDEVGSISRRADPARRLWQMKSPLLNPSF